jgi:hypothetical protein
MWEPAFSEAGFLVMVPNAIRNTKFTTRVRSGHLGTPSCEFDQSSKEGAPHLRVLSEDGDLDFETDVKAKN